CLCARKSLWGWLAGDALRQRRSLRLIGFIADIPAFTANILCSSATSHRLVTGATILPSH
ncbi:hypothetical protein, partial [Pseudomonas soli]|uniref:hypothetical protein n=1 Tax=Pseudomonas soli TaxID=1306993 RepID=UPI001F3CC85E